MGVHVVFLRAINLGPRRRVPMGDLVGCLEAAGFRHVATYLATGNARVGSARRTTASVERAVEEALATRFGFEVPTIALTRAELAEVVEETSSTPDAARSYVTLLKRPPDAGAARALEEATGPGERLRLGRRALHWWADHDMRDGRLDNATIEKHLGVATTRTAAVVRTVHERWGTDD